MNNAIKMSEINPEVLLAILSSKKINNIEEITNIKMSLFKKVVKFFGYELIRIDDTNNENG